MTPAQRDTVRKSLADPSAGMTSIGCETLRTLHTGTSNWIPGPAGCCSWSARLRASQDTTPNTYRRFANAQANFIASMYPTGEAFPGLGEKFHVPGST